jgi:hypothetical protein
LVRPVVAALGLAVSAAIGSSACSRGDESVEPAPEAFCEAVIDLEDGLAELAGEAEDVQIRGQIRLVRRVVETAPRPVEADARIFLAALEAVRDNPDDPSLRDDPDVEEAVANVERYAIEGCELFERDGGGSPF